MHMQLPILARHAAAIPETLGNAGLTFADDDPGALAEMLHLLATDTPTRERLIAAGMRRVAEFTPATVTQRWVTAVGEMIGAP
jgi:glycosyltransferase involved in cell wall biosynthesis